MTPLPELVGSPLPRLAAKIAARGVLDRGHPGLSPGPDRATDGEYHAFLHVSASQAYWRPPPLST